MLRALRYRHVFFAVGASTTALILAILWAIPHFTRPPSGGASTARTVASILGPPEPPINLADEPAICKDVYQVVCHGLGDADRDPTGMVRPDVEGERIVTSMYQDLIANHPDWTPEQIDDELAKMIYTPDRRGRIEAAFHWVQARIEHFIEIQPDRIFNSHEKKELLERIRSTILEIPPPASVYADEPDLLMTNDVFFERTVSGVRRMRVGGAYLFTAKSWFNMVFTIGHELGHAIDPCEIRGAGISIPSYDRLEACFLKTGVIATPKNRVECGDADQLSEAFADWLGSKITAEALQTFSSEFHGLQLIHATGNAVRDLCDQDDEDGDLDVVDHPPPAIRIGKIFGGQPEIRAVLGCTAYDKLPPEPPRAAVGYCELDPKATL